MNELDKIIKTFGPILTQKAPWINGTAALAALAENESRYGQFNIPKHERAYDFSGKYFQPDLWRKFGSWSACSYSSWQLMYPVAVELGFAGRPQDLACDEIAIYWVMKYIDQRIIQKGCQTLEQFADAYNSGSFRDQIIPEKYIKDFLTSYADVVVRRGLA